MQELATYPVLLDAINKLSTAQDHFIDLAIQVQQIPAPTGQEEARAQWVEGYFRQLGLQDVSQDALFNVYGRIPGHISTPALLVSAHSDTVFPADIDLTVKRDANTNRVYGPGIGDNSAGVAGLLLLGEQLQALLLQNVLPPVDIWLVVNSGEEGLGDLRGMRAAVERLASQVGASVVIEGMGLGRIVHRALGSRRFRISVQAPGGHSWSDFGTASAIHILAQIAADITKLKVPQEPRTTFNIGRIQGGTSINTIAQHASLELDIRSEDATVLQNTVDQCLRLLRRYQSPALQKTGVSLSIETIGDRPGGEITTSHPLVHAAVRSLQTFGVTNSPDLRISSTDANIPLSRAIPAICIGITEGGNAHRLEEWMSIKPLAAGLQHLLSVTWWSAMWLGGEISQEY